MEDEPLVWSGGTLPEQIEINKQLKEMILKIKKEMPLLWTEYQSGEDEIKNFTWFRT